MSSDASAAAASPMTNGTSRSGSHREADASTTAATTPAEQIHTLADVCADVHGRVSNFLSAEPESEVTRRTQEQTKISIQVIEKALQDYDFDALSLSYNGGKDCLVLLILYLSVLHTHFTSPTGRRKDNTAPSSFPTTIPSIYAKPPDPFPAVTSFVESSTRDYHLDLVHISTNPGIHPNPSKAKSHSSPPATLATPTASATNTTDTPSNAQISPYEPPTILFKNHENMKNKTITFRDAFALYLQTHPRISAIFVGTRRTDPHGSTLTHFDLTDGNWPRFMRIHPVIDWHLSEIWTFLRSPYLADKRNSGKEGETLGYCSMYDEGYTSLGGVGDTLRNPRLRIVERTRDGREVERWDPAWKMGEDGSERLGRE